MMIVTVFSLQAGNEGMSQREQQQLTHFLDTVCCGLPCEFLRVDPSVSQRRVQLDLSELKFTRRSQRNMKNYTTCLIVIRGEFVEKA